MTLIQISDDACRFLARIDDLDQPVRRIFPIRRFLDAVRLKEMALVPPQLWDDPREDPTALCMLDGRKLSPARGQQPLSAYLAPVWAQCWSLNPGSDTLLRAYSRVSLDPEQQKNGNRDDEGITVTTTIRLLLAAAEGWHADGADGHVVIGRVEYLDDGEIWQRIVNACNGEHGPGFFRTVQGRADSLMWKRAYFDHEQEVRLMLIARTEPKDAAVPRVRPLRIDPNLLFQSVSFDPRLLPGIVREREAELRDAGYGGEILPDTSYQKVLGLLEMQRDWPDP